MFLKKFLKRKNKLLSGQACLEYFIIFAVVGVLGLISVSSLIPRIREAIYKDGGYFEEAADAIINADR
jgi:hypothetical protein